MYRFNYFFALRTAALLLFVATACRCHAACNPFCVIGLYLSTPDAVRLKTNLAYDVFAIHNIAGEFKVSDHVSVEVPLAWSLWDWKQSLGLRAFAIQPGARYYLRGGGTGHAFGGSVIAAWYNFRKDSRRYQSASRPAVGLEANYSYTVSLGKGFLAEFSVGFGWGNTSHNIYYNIDNGALTDRRTLNYLGPTRLGVSLVYAF